MRGAAPRDAFGIADRTTDVVSKSHVLGQQAREETNMSVHGSGSRLGWNRTMATTLFWLLVFAFSAAAIQQPQNPPTEQATPESGLRPNEPEPMERSDGQPPTTEVDGASVARSEAVTRLLWVEVGLLAIVLLVLPTVSLWRANGARNDARGLGLPRGSVRSMLAIVIVGSTINFLLFGSEVAGDGFSEVVAALTTLSGSVIGFYFGGRTAAPPPDNN